MKTLFPGNIGAAANLARLPQRAGEGPAAAGLGLDSERGLWFFGSLSQQDTAEVLVIGLFP